MRRIALLVVAVAGCGDDGGGAATDAARPDAPEPDAPGPDGGTAVANRDRLIRTYFERLREMPDVVQSNGVRGADVANPCALWSALDPSARAVFLTITARLDGSRLGAGGGTMLDHVTRMTRVRGGEGATATDHGACGGEGNRLFLSVDRTLHAALIATVGGAGGLADIPDGAVWRDSNDAAGPHAPFTASAETERGAPRGQGHFFLDPASPVATAPLGRVDLETLVDPFAFEIDQDYDCVHASNPLCDYTFYGPLCAPAMTSTGVDIYERNYGSYLPTWTPTGC